MKNFYKKGFTLIELLVVIAIIGILASVVLASLNTARAKGADAAIKANLANTRAQAELDYDSEGCYLPTASAACTGGAVFAAAACPAVSGVDNVWDDTTINSAIDAAEAAAGATATCAQADDGGAWAISVALKQTGVAAGFTGTDYWCVDSAGASKAIDNALATTNC